MAKKMTYEELMQFIHDERNIQNCIECPYEDECKDIHPDYALPCNQRDCWVNVVCDLDKKYKNRVLEHLRIMKT